MAGLVFPFKKTAPIFSQKPEIEILAAGTFCSVQDLGRAGFASLGVPSGGAMDRESAALANLLAGNAPDAPVLEITETGTEILGHCRTVFALAGADLSPILDGKPMRNGHAFQVSLGQILRFQQSKTGFRCYLAVRGGFQMTKIMGSASFCRGISPKPFLKKGDRLAVLPFSENHLPTFSGLKNRFFENGNSPIEVWPGPEWDWLDAATQDFLLNSDLRISPKNDRMACQLEPKLGFPRPILPEMLTSPVRPGTVQLTPGGQLIVLMRDAQTTGGYPRVVQVLEKGINRVAQKRVGEVVRFKFEI